MIGTVASMVALWPEPFQQTEMSGSDGEIVTARITQLTEVPCDPGMPPLETPPEADPPTQQNGAQCLEARATLPIGESITFTINSLTLQSQSFNEDDQVQLIKHEINLGETTEARYSFYGYPRAAKMLTIAIAFALIVVAVGRWRGVLAIVGVGAAIALLVTFVLPAILEGKPPVFVAVVGATGIMLVVLYLAHGVSHRTTAALFGSIFGILFTALAGYAVTSWLRFAGIGSTDDASLAIAVPGLQMNDVLTATIVVAGLGILNDITVAQASAVWEMRSLNPALPKRRVYLSAMRVGRDHIASSIYTLVFAYAGSMLVVLLLIYTYPRDLVDLVTTEQIGQEIIRTLIGASGLVLSMPVTTACAVWFIKEPTNSTFDT